jgi:hypothetical protein
MKHRLRHPVRAIEEPFGKAGLIVAVIALVLALTGAAFAAAGLNSKQKKEVTKIAKKFAGAPGPAGPQGPAGTNGTNGKEGAAGKAGTNGANGKSVVLVNEEPAGCEHEEGLTYEIEGSGVQKEVCRGPEGSPWTAGGTLPSEKTETGAWTVTSNTSENVGPINTTISFPIPLASALAANKVHYVVGSPTEGHGDLTESSKTISNVTTESGQFLPGEEISGTGIPVGALITAVDSGAETLTLTANATASGTSVKLTAGVPASAAAACSGTAAAPTAAQGNLCVYATEETNIGPSVGPPFHPINPPSSQPAYVFGGADTSGALLTFGPAGSNPRHAYGTWAVTAP